MCVYICYASLISYIGSSLQACIAMSPDEQLNKLKNMWRKQKCVEIATCKEDNEIIKYYLNEVS